MSCSSSFKVVGEKVVKLSIQTLARCKKRDCGRRSVTRFK